MKLAVFSFIISAILPFSQTHVRLVCPRPHTPRSDLVSTSLLLDTICPGDKESSVTDIQPGLFTVRFEETKFIKGSPFRILLVDNGSPTLSPINNTNSTSETLDRDMLSCLLLDHIPHNDHAVITDTCSKKGNTYPLGICRESTYYITVRIPDVSCEDCSLVLQQVDVPPDHSVCDLTSTNDSLGNCFVFSSCAKVKIRPSKRGVQKDLQECGNYLKNMPGDWPYRPQDLFKTEHRVILTLDLLHKSLHVEIPKDFPIAFIERVEIVQDKVVRWNSTLQDELSNIESHFLVWESLNLKDISDIKAGKLALNVIGSKKAITSDIIFINEHFRSGLMSILHDVYSPQGWLSSRNFMGPHAENLEASLPVGQCSPPAHYFMSYMESIHTTAHGVLGMTIVDNRAYVTSVLHEDKEEIESLRLMPPELVAIPNLEIDTAHPFDDLVQAAVDLNTYIPLLGTERFLNSVEVKTDKEDAVLFGRFEEGMYVVLRDESGQVCGMGALQVTQGQWIQVEIEMHNKSNIQSAHLQGIDSKLVDINTENMHCTRTFCCLEVTMKALTAELVLHLMTGQASLHVDLGDRNLSGQVLSSVQRYCEMTDGKCEAGSEQFSLSGVGVHRTDNISGGLESSGGWVHAATYMVDRSGLFMYCVQFWDKSSSTANHSVEASLSIDSRELDSVSLQPVADLTGTYLACRQFLLDGNFSVLASLTQEDATRVKLTVMFGGEAILSQEIPQLEKSPCPDSQIHTVGKEKHYWSASSAPLSDIFLVVSDSLVFNIIGNDTTLYLANSKEAFISCDFNSADEILSSPETRYIHTLQKPGTLYFMDSNSCNFTSPLKLVVHVAQKDSFNRPQSWCRASVYSMWRARLIESHASQTSDVSGRVILGLVLGLCLSAAFLIWQGFKLHILPGSSRGRQDQLF